MHASSPAVLKPGETPGCLFSPKGNPDAVARHEHATRGRNLSIENRRRLAILYPGNRAARDRADPAESRFKALFEAFKGTAVAAEPAIYSDDFRDEVSQQLSGVHGVLVWHNPVEGGRDRGALDGLLRYVAAKGVFVSTHPDTILKLGTKDVLLSVRDLPFGSDVHSVATLAHLRDELPGRLTRGARVLKQRRGHSGIGVWRIEQRGEDRYALRHAQRGATEELVNLASVLQRLAPYFEHGGHMIDQAWQPRMVEGMTRAYLVRDRVAGFGHQAVVALHPHDEA
ncbi:MAG: Cj0069 family protein, partial [Cytophagales bacterium]|nr:Cj0069 family protein [Rhizobacter sp.]